MIASTSEFESAGTSLPRRRTADRRQKGRLRELCEEVLASYRLAKGSDVLTAEERQSANEMLARVTPLITVKR